MRSGSSSRHEKRYSESESDSEEERYKKAKAKPPSRPASRQQSREPSREPRDVRREEPRRLSQYSDEDEDEGYQRRRDGSRAKGVPIDSRDPRGRKDVRSGDDERKATSSRGYYERTSTRDSMRDDSIADSLSQQDLAPRKYKELGRPLAYSHPPPTATRGHLSKSSPQPSVPIKLKGIHEEVVSIETNQKGKKTIYLQQPSAPPGKPSPKEAAARQRERARYESSSESTDRVESSASLCMWFLFWIRSRFWIWIWIWIWIRFGFLVSVSVSALAFV
jgi:hypothetical protein